MNPASAAYVPGSFSGVGIGGNSFNTQSSFGAVGGGSFNTQGSFESGAALSGSSLSSGATSYHQMDASVQQGYYQQVGVQGMFTMSCHKIT